MADHLSRQERLLKKQVASHRCPQCRRSFQQEHVRVAARHEDLWVVSVRCASCRKQQIFWIALGEVNEEEHSTADLSVEEREFFDTLPPVAPDDILNMHEFLARFDGDFRRLFADRSRDR